MEHDEQVVLQQRVRARSIEYARRSHHERVGGTKRQQEEVREHRQQHRERPADEWLRKSLAHPPRDGSNVSRQHQHPHQDGAFECAPHCSKVVQRRRGIRTDLLHVEQREVPGDHRPLHHRERPNGHGCGQHNETRHQPQRLHITAPRPNCGSERTEECCEKTNEQECSPQLCRQAGYEHADFSASSSRSAFSASYSLECFTSMRVAKSTPSTILP